MKPASTGDLREFFRQLAVEEDRVVTGQLAPDRLGLTMRVAINELDLAEFIARTDGISPDQEQDLQILRMGVARCLRLMLSLHEGFPYHALTLRRKNQPVARVTRTLGYLGFIQHARRIAQTVQAGATSFSKSASGRFEFSMPARLVDNEGVERDIDEHYRREHLRVRDELFSSPEGLRASTTIRELLDENVFVFRGHFIGYSGDPLLDRHYFTIAWSDLQDAGDFDSFNELREFGGVRFLKYLLAVAFVNSAAMKHEAFARALCRKDNNIVFDDILTISADKSGVIDSLMGALNQYGADFVNYTETNREEAEKIYDIISLSRRNVELLDNPVAAVPCTIEFSAGGIVQFLAGRHRQMEFVLDALRMKYPAEYDANQQTRERSFQKAIENLLQSSFPGLETRRNIHIREGRRDLTDVDLVVIDRIFGNLFLLQLKFQDRPGPDFRRQASRMGRFKRESVKWLQALGAWLERADDKKLRETFQIPRDVTVRRIRKLVIGRHHAWPLREVGVDDDTAYANWPQLTNAVLLMERQQGDFRTLDGLFASLRKHIVGAPDRYYVNEGEQEYVLDGLTFAIVQAAD